MCLLFIIPVDVVHKRFQMGCHPRRPLTRVPPRLLTFLINPLVLARSFSRRNGPNFDHKKWLHSQFCGLPAIVALPEDSQSSLLGVYGCEGRKWSVDSFDVLLWLQDLQKCPLHKIVKWVHFFVHSVLQRTSRSHLASFLDSIAQHVISSKMGIGGKRKCSFESIQLREWHHQ